MTVAGRVEHEDLVQTIARIERLGKGLFGVTACVVQLHAADEMLAETAFASSAHRFCADLPLGEVLQLMPEKASPFSPALGKVDNFEVRFCALQPLRDRAGNVVGRVVLIHERSRAFTSGDGHWMADLAALIERELHFSGFSADAPRTGS
ncbi:GAF domain-containing protein [Herminiimonas sp. NPDC097707]|uniref:GAF domain-containing protein n=1 Tax=Herminiimonas sp. NPDC097707 TaxID=3364007 RepID=UPI00383B97E7